MKLQEVIKSIIIVSGLSLNTANATEQVENQVCKTLELTIWDENCVENWNCEKIILDIEDWKWELKIENKKYSIEIWNNWIATVSDEGDVNWSDISWEVEFFKDK